MYRYIIESRAPISLVRVEDETEPLEPPTPPVIPPPIIPPPPPARGPFIWPPEITLEGDPTNRSKFTWNIPGRRDDDPHGHIYAFLSQVGRPDTAHHNAGVIQAGDLEGFRAWAPKNAPDEMLWAIIEGRM